MQRPLPQRAHTEVLSTSSAQLVVITGVVVDACLGQHRVVLDLGSGQEQKVDRGQQDSLPEGWRVVGDDDQLALAIPEGLDGLLVAQTVLREGRNTRGGGQLTLPDFITSASLELIDSLDFLTFFAATMMIWKNGEQL